MQKCAKMMQKNNKRGHSAVKTRSFPLVKSKRTVNKRLDGQVITGQEKIHCSALLPEEEETIVRYVINKNLCYRGISKAQLTTSIRDLKQHNGKV